MGVIKPDNASESTIAWDRDAQCTRVVPIRECVVLDLDTKQEVERVMAVDVEAGWVEAMASSLSVETKRRRGRFQLVVKRGKP